MTRLVLISSCLLIAIFTSTTFAQGLDPANAVSTNGLNKAFYDVIGRQPIQKEGIYFIEEDYFITELTSYKLGKIKDVPARYDLFTSQFEVAVKSARYSLRGDLVKSFSWYNTNSLRKMNYLNVLDFDTEKKLKGFFQVLLNGEVSLLFHEEIAYYSGTQSPSVNNNAGTESMTKVSEYYLAKVGVAQKVYKNRKKNEHLFGEHRAKMNAYIKEHKLNYKTRGHLLQITTYYNKLLADR